MHADRPQPSPSRNGPAAASRAARSGWQEADGGQGLAPQSGCTQQSPCAGGSSKSSTIARRRKRSRTSMSVGTDHPAPWPAAFAFVGARRREPGARSIRPGSLTLITAGTRLGWRRDQATEALVVTLDPRFVAAWPIARHATANVEFLTLVAFEDPAITYILRAMQTALSGRCARSRLYDEALATALVSHLLSHYAVRPIEQETPGRRSAGGPASPRARLYRGASRRGYEPAPTGGARAAERRTTSRRCSGRASACRRTAMCSSGGSPGRRISWREPSCPWPRSAMPLATRARRISSRCSAG